MEDINKYSALQDMIDFYHNLHDSDLKAAALDALKYVIYEIDQDPKARFIYRSKYTYEFPIGTIKIEFIKPQHKVFIASSK